MEAIILLEDGTRLIGESFGAEGTVLGEIVFNTGMTGYQEILTDPSYAGQIVTMTYPLIGNYGVNTSDIESSSVKVSGFIVKEYSEKPNHWQMNASIHEYLKANNIIGVSGVDTRMLTKRIRTKGAMNCIITTDKTLSNEELLKELKGYVFPVDIVSQVSTESSYKKSSEIDKKKSVGVIDLGLKQGIVKQLTSKGCDVTVYPYNVSKADLEGKHDAILFSNGPGDPKDCGEAIQLAKDIKGELPIFGICLGHQVLSLALGADTYKLKFGHRGSNHPVIDLRNNRVYMTSQNHGYAVDSQSLPEGMTLTHMNVNDDTVEGMCFEDLNIESVQFHPEEGPGPTDATVIFKDWIDKIERN